VVARLNAAVNEVLQLPAVREARLKAGSELSAPLSPGAALAFYRAERDTYKPIARRIKPE
jgi:tripartite-type tricarboxylate transporter receptor subunit TctC